MTKLFIGSLILLAGAGSCLSGKEPDTDVKFNKSNEVLIDETTVVVPDEIPDTLSVAYKSTLAIDRFIELRQALDDRLAMEYSKDDREFYLSFRRQNERLLENINSDNFNLLETYSQSYDLQKHKYVPNDSLKAALKPFYNAKLRISTYEDSAVFELDPLYYFGLSRPVL
jgi:hypothetical protein